MVRRSNLTWMQVAAFLVTGTLCGLLLSAGLASGEKRSAGRPETAPAPAEPPPTVAGAAAERTDNAPVLEPGAQEDPPERTPEGAVAAAVSYAVQGQELIDGDSATVEALVREMAAEATADEQVEAAYTALAYLRDALAEGTGPTIYRQTAVSYRVDAFSPDRAQVAVWTVGVLAREDVAPPQADWSIQLYDLVWERNAWRVWESISLPGPAPILNDSVAPASITEFLAALEGFEDLGSPW